MMNMMNLLSSTSGFFTQATTLMAPSWDLTMSADPAHDPAIQDVPGSSGMDRQGDAPAPDGLVAQSDLGGSGVITRPVSPFANATAHDAIKATVVQDLLIRVAPFGSAVVAGKHKLDAHQYANAVLSAPDIHELMKRLNQIQPEVLFSLGEVEGTPETGGSADINAFPSMRACGVHPARAVEYNKLAVSFWLVVCLINCNYEFMKKSVAPLSDEKLGTFRAQFMAMLGPDPEGNLEFNPEKLRAFLVHMACHDLGKVAAFKLAYQGVAAALVANHDDVLAQAFHEGLDFLVPTYRLLTQEGKDLFNAAIKAAAKMNIPQVPQGEASPFMFASMAGMSAEEAEFFIFHIMIDTYGSKGFQSPDRPFLPAFLHPVLEAAIPHIKTAVAGDTGFDPIAAYANVIKSSLGPMGESLDCNDPVDLAKARLMGHFPTRMSKPTAKDETLPRDEKLGIFLAAWEALSESIRARLVATYGANGINDGHIGLTMQYSPSLIENVLYYYANVEQLPAAEALRKALADCLPFLARVGEEVNHALAGRSETSGSFLVNLQKAAEAFVEKRTTPDSPSTITILPSELLDCDLDVQLTVDGVNIGIKRGLPAPDTLALIRLQRIAGDNTDATALQAAFDAQDVNTCAILVNAWGRGAAAQDLDSQDVSLYRPVRQFPGAGDLLSQMTSGYQKFGDSDFKAQALKDWLFALAQLQHKAGIETRKIPGGGQWPLPLTELGHRAASATSRKEFRNLILSVEADSQARALHLGIANFDDIDLSAFPHLDSLANLPGHFIVPIAIGGGSDPAQAEAFGLLLEKAGKKVPAIISVRTAKTGSAGADGRMGEERLLENHGGEIYPGVFIITENTTTKGRLAERDVAAGGRFTLTVIDRQDGRLAEQIRFALSYLRDSGVQIDTLAGVDTGGDGLYPASTEGTAAAKATPDQDLRVLTALTELQNAGDVANNFITVEIAAGIDTPSNYAAVLAAAGAAYYRPTAPETAMLETIYTSWGFTPFNPKQYGKTQEVWRRAQQGESGVLALSLPTQTTVLHPTNPWEIYVPVKPSMAGMFIMNLADYAAAIGITATGATDSDGGSGDRGQRQDISAVLLDRQQKELAAARALVAAFKQASKPVLTLSPGNQGVGGGDGEETPLTWQINYQTGTDGSMTGGSTAQRLTLRMDRPRHPIPAGETEETRPDYNLAANDLDPAVRVVIPRLRAMLGEIGGGYEEVTTGNRHHFNFLFARWLVVPDRHSYNGKATVLVRLSRDVGAAGTTIPDPLPLRLEIGIEGYQNDQPIGRKGETYWEGSDFVETVREKDIFSEHGYGFSEELGDEALAQVIARLIRAGIVVPG